MLCRNKIKSAGSEMAARRTKTETLVITRVLMVRISSKEDIFDVLSKKEAVVGAIPVDDGGN